MKIKGASAYTCYVKDLDKTADFYEALGLTVKERTPNRLIIYINWYRIDFVKVSDDDYPQFRNEAEAANRGAGIFLYFSVDDVDETYKEMVAAGIKPATEPTDQPWGAREFVTLDPDGYKLVMFKRKVNKNPQN